MATTEVAVVKCTDYAQVEKAVRRCISLLGGVKKFVRKNDRVLIKPNLSDPLPPETAATTHPLLIKAVIELVKEAGGIPVVGEQAAGNKQGVTAETFEVSGVQRVCQETKATLINFQEGHFVQKDIANYKVLEKIDFAEALLKADAIINLPKLKSHGITYLTGAVKNFFGCVHHGEREYLHRFTNEDFSHGLVDIYSFVRPKIVLNIMDAVVAMEGDEGPSYGPPKATGYLIASSDAVAVDIAAAELIDHRPLLVHTNKAAVMRRLFRGGFKNLEYLGDPLEPCEDFKAHKSYLNSIAKREHVLLQPIITEKCVKCRSCFESCPEKAIYETAAQFRIDEQKCIQCQCCREVCTYAAIDMYEKALQQKRIANIRLGLECNQDCLFCTVADDEEETLNTKEAEKKLKELFDKGLDEVTFTGGEPTLRKDLPALFKLLKDENVSIELQSNGVILSDEAYVKGLKSSGLRGILIALHSHKEDVSNKLTKSKQFRATVEGLKNCVRNGIKTSVSHVINELNYKDLVGFARFMRTFSNDIHLYYGFVRPNGNTARNKWLVPKLVDVERHLYDAMNYCQKNKISFSLEGIPLCYAQGYEKHSEESKRILREPQKYTGKGNSGHEDLHKFIHSELKRKSEACSHCCLNNYCPGVWREYAEIHGTGELFPVFNEVEW